MSGPLIPSGVLSGWYGLPAALAVGILFGFFLERAGFGNSRKLTALFYLEDFAVLRVMFTAVAVSSVGLLILDSANLLDLSRVFVPPTYIWPQIVGGLLIGSGFAVGGY